MEEHQLIVTRKERPNSYEYGKAGNRITLYFNDAIDLEQQIEDLKEIGVWTDENA